MQLNTQANMFKKENLLEVANTKMPFGKYAGNRLIDLPEEYLLWFANKDWPKGKLGFLMQLTLEIKINGLDDIIEPLKHSLNP